MKTLTILLQAKQSSEKEIPKRTKTGKLLRIILTVCLLSWMTLLSSCLVSPPSHGGSYGYHGNRENRGNNGHHGDNDDRGNHNNDDPHHK